MQFFRVHHTNLPEYLKEMKKYHLGHHYKSYDLGFGVTSTFIFATLGWVVAHASL